MKNLFLLLTLALTLGGCFNPNVRHCKDANVGDVFRSIEVPYFGGKANPFEADTFVVLEKIDGFIRITDLPHLQMVRRIGYDSDIRKKYTQTLSVTEFCTKIGYDIKKINYKPKK